MKSFGIKRLRSTDAAAGITVSGMIGIFLMKLSDRYFVSIITQQENVKENPLLQPGFASLVSLSSREFELREDHGLTARVFGISGNYPGQLELSPLYNAALVYSPQATSSRLALE